MNVIEFAEMAVRIDALIEEMERAIAEAEGE